MSEDNTGIVAFHAFKGGVGRTMALLGVAFRFYLQGRRVLLVDGDVDAPGLSLLEGLKGDMGLLDLLRPGARAVGCTPFPKAQLPRPLAEGGALEILPIRTAPPDYSELLEVVSEAIQDESRAPFEWMRWELKRLRTQGGLPFDYVLIDLRAGLSGFSTRVMEEVADLVLLFSGLNEQNISGTAGVRATLLDGGGALEKVGVVATPIPPNTTPGLEARQDLFRRTLGSPLAWIPYDPLLALTERAAWPPEHPFRSTDGLLASHWALASAVSGWFGDESASEMLKRVDLAASDDVADIIYGAGLRDSPAALVLLEGVAKCAELDAVDGKVSAMDGGARERPGRTLGALRGLLSLGDLPPDPLKQAIKSLCDAYEQGWAPSGEDGALVDQALDSGWTLLDTAAMRKFAASLGRSPRRTVSEA